MERTEYLSHGGFELSRGNLEHKLGGAVLTKFTIGYKDLVAAATSQKVGLFSVPPLAKVGLRVLKHSEAFEGETLSALTVSLGLADDADFYSSALDVFADPASNPLVDASETPAMVAGEHMLVATFTATDSNLGADGATILTAGSVDIWVEYRELP